MSIASRTNGRSERAMVANAGKVPNEGVDITIFRLYCPTEAVTNKNWKPGDIEKVECAWEGTAFFDIRGSDAGQRLPKPDNPLSAVSTPFGNDLARTWQIPITEYPNA
jgi:hypothetical protein